MRIVVPVSGGKDSQACLKMAVDEHGAENVEGLFCDTQFEHPKTYAHIEFLRLLYGVTIHVITAGSVGDKVRKHKRFPDWNSRHCTDELKLRPTRDWLAVHVLFNGPFEVWYGMRSAESNQRANRYSGKNATSLYQPHEVMARKYPKYLGKWGVRFKLPILHWSEDDVFEYLAGTENPLYDDGFDRVGCFPCLAAGKRHKDKAFAHDDFGRSQRKVVWLMEHDIGKSVYDGGPPGYAGCETCGI